MKILLHNIHTWLILSLFVIGIQSCADNNTEEEEMLQTELSFTVALPTDVSSRSFGKAEQVNTLVVGVFNDRQVEVYRKSYSIEDSSINISLTLAQNQTYHFVFWAYDNRLNIYNMEDLTAIRMTAIPDAITFSQAEAMDAFFATQKHVTVMGDKNYLIKLVRPLAQINVGTIGTPMLASFTAKGVPDTFHPFTNSVSGTADYIWNFCETTSETFTVDGKEYNYLAMGYVFAPTIETEIATELTLNDGGKSHTVEFSRVEIEANSRSNIAGRFTGE